MRSLLYFLLLLLPLGISAQAVYPYDLVAFNPKGNAVAPPDTKPQGVIKVRKPVIRPYFKCEYYLTLSRVQEVEVLVPDENLPGTFYRDKVPVFDSAYSFTNERVYPAKDIHISRQLVDSIEYAYSMEDTASIDTMVVEMWIGTNGKIKWKRPDTTFNGEMPRELEVQLYNYAMGLDDWGKGGGYKEPKKFLRKQRSMAGNYYCVLYIIASAKPLTSEQRHTGARYAPFDIPLNSPPGDDRQREFIEDNREAPVNDSNR